MLYAIDALFFCGALSSFAVAFAGIGLIVRGIKAERAHNLYLAERRAVYRAKRNAQRIVAEYNDIVSTMPTTTTPTEHNNILADYYNKPIYELLTPTRS